MAESKTLHQGHGCPLHKFQVEPAPEYDDAYSLGAWMKGPLGMDKQSVCDLCISKIESGTIPNYTYNPETKEVKEMSSG